MEEFKDAVRERDAARLRALLAAHPELRSAIDRPDFGEGFTPIDHAALRGHVDTVRLLIGHAADLEIRNNYGGTALDGCQWGSLNFRNPTGDDPACAEALVQAGARVAYPGFGSDAVKAVLQRYASSH